MEMREFNESETYMVSYESIKTEFHPPNWFWLYPWVPNLYIKFPLLSNFLYSISISNIHVT